MEFNHIQQIIQHGEGLNVAFKKATDELPANLFETLSYFILHSNYQNSIQIGRAEELGTGIRKIFKYRSLYSGDVPSILEGDIFEVKIPLLEDSVVKKVPDKVTDKITINQEKILTFMLANPRISMSQIASELGISKRKTLDNINKLKQLGRVSRVGSSKGGYWEIIKINSK